MKILGISGGAKDGRNDCICKEALLGAQEAGAEVEFIHLFDLDIKHCTGCNICVKRMMTGQGNDCVLNDDIKWLQNEILDADGIIFSMPIFEKGAAAIFRTLTDRFGPRADKGMLMVSTEIAQKSGKVVPDPRFLKDRAVSYIGIGGSDWMTRVQCDFNVHAMISMWKIVDNEVFDWAGCVVAEEERVKRAREIGSNLAYAAKDIGNASYLGIPGVCPHCNCREFYFSQDNKAICCSCGIEGRIEMHNNSYEFLYEEEQLKLAHDTIEGKFKHSDDINVNTGRAMEIMNTPAIKEKIAYYKGAIPAKRP